MSPFVIGNLNNPPLSNINGSLVNIDNSHVGGIPMANTIMPKGPYTLDAAGTNVQSASGIYPCVQKGGKINRKNVNKISKQYKMKSVRKTFRRSFRKMKSRVRSRFTRRNRNATRSLTRIKRRAKRMAMAGGAFQSHMISPNYPAGYTQYQNNNGSLSNTYSTGGDLPVSLSALANPVPYQHVAGDVDNLNHNTLNSYGNIGAGSGFASRGWF